MELNYTTPKTEFMAMDSGELLTMSVALEANETERDRIDSVGV